MKVHKILLRSVLFVAVFYILTLLIQMVIFYSARQVEVGKWGRRNKIQSGSINSDIIFVGTSRAAGHFNPEIISEFSSLSAYNLGMGGSAINAQLPMLKFYLKYNQPPEILVYNAGNHSVGFDTESRDPFYDLPYISEPVIYQSRIAIDEYFWLHKYLPPMNLYLFNTSKQKELIEGVYRTVFNLPDEWINGFHEYPGKIDSKKMNRLETDKDFREQFSYNQMSDQHYDCLIEMIQLCKSLDIKIFFVFTPQYYESYKYQSNKSATIDTYYRLADEYGFIYMNYSEHPICYESENFSGLRHLNKKGADLFSEEFARDLMTILTE